ncbi:MAG: hypothetical protein M1835_000367 [Candelina submexicana]|nr:MAG: hypothetical protein M1835_000367 [Candelina submexicana]
MSKPVKSLTPRQLKDFQKGEQVSVYLGPDLSTREIVSSGRVYKKVLAEFSPYCQRTLIEEKKGILWLEMVGNKEVLKFAISWMSAGGWDIQRKLQTMDANMLMDLYRFSVKLEILALQSESQRLLSPAVAKLAIPDALRFYRRCRELELDFAQQKAENRLCYLLRSTVLEVQQVKFVYQNTTIVDSAIRNTIAHKLAIEFFHQRLDDKAYSDYCAENAEFNADMLRAWAGIVPKVPHCHYCYKKGHTEEKCYALHPELVPSRVVKVNCAHCGKTTHAATECWRLYPELAPPHLRDAIIKKSSAQQAKRTPTKKGNHIRSSDGGSITTTASLNQFFKLKKNQAWKPSD